MTGFSTFGSGGAGGGLKYDEVMQIVEQQLATKQDAGDYATAADIAALTVSLAQKATDAALQAAIAQFATPVKDSVGDARLFLAGQDTAGYVFPGAYLRANYPILSAKYPANALSAIDGIEARQQSSSSTKGAGRFKGKWWLFYGTSNAYKSDTAAEGSWAYVGMPASAYRPTARGDDNLMAVTTAPTGSAMSSVITSPDGVTFTSRSSHHLVYGGVSGDYISRIRPHPGDPGRFLVCGTRNVAGDRALLYDTPDFTGTNGVRYPMQPTDALVVHFAFWPSEMVWVCGMSDGTIQTSPAGGTAQAPTITGPWTIRATGLGGSVNFVVPDGDNIYILAAKGRVAIANRNNPWVFVTSILDPGVSAWTHYKKFGNTFLLTASSSAAEGRSRMLTTQNFQVATTRYYTNGTFAVTPEMIAGTATQALIADDAGKYGFSTVLDIDPNLQLQIPPMPSVIPNARWGVKAG